MKIQIFIAGKDKFMVNKYCLRFVLKKNELVVVVVPPFKKKSNQMLRSIREIF